MIDEDYLLTIDEDSVDSYMHELELIEVSAEPELVSASSRDPQTSLVNVMLATTLLGSVFIGVLVYFLNRKRRDGVDTRTVAVHAEMEGCSNLRQVQGILSDYFSDFSTLKGDDMGLSLISRARDLLMTALESGEVDRVITTVTNPRRR